MRLRGSRGFTLVELLLVLFVVALLASLVAPVVTGSIQRARESSLKEDLHVMRKAIDDFYADTGRYPESLVQLVEKRYLRKVPVDPMTGNNTSWRVIMEDAMTSVNQSEPGIFDVRSGSDAVSLEGTPYSEW